MALPWTPGTRCRDWRALRADLFRGRPIRARVRIPGEVLRIIATHSHEGDKVERSIESIIFHHADFVDFDIAKFLGNARRRSDALNKWPAKHVIDANFFKCSF
jgi:hypothetical protein